MTIKTARSLTPAFMILLIAVLACSLPGQPAPSPTSAPLEQPVEAPQATQSEEPVNTIVPFTPTAEITHLMRPADTAPNGQMVYDVVSEDTAPEKRAPYGDSYDINRMERPFLQDMTYVPDLDIYTYTVSEDDDWWYVSLNLVGADPNNALGINYAVELDKNHDGFGDFIIWASPPYGNLWDTAPVKIFQDTNHNTGGLTGSKSDAPIEGDGYDTQVFNGGQGDADPDLAWARINASDTLNVQFAFKKSWSGTVFMLGVLADANFRDVQKFDLVDRMKEQEAGSPVRDKTYYPLKAIFAIDNVCREAFGFKETGNEPQLCPREEQKAGPRPHEPGGPTPVGPCQPPPGGCGPKKYWVPAPFCFCNTYIY